MSLFENKEVIEEKIIDNLKKVFDPEIPVNIYDLGLIYSIDFEEKGNYLHCNVLMTLTSPACPVAESLVEQVKYVTLAVDEVDEAYVNLTFNPPWSKDLMSEEGREIMEVSGAVI
ncbi:metal-sulfur cluster assembly factor [Arcobacter sp. YIC-464]|uniref:metal-sulfur cluster assembly factor n=1 Tax=Arcobacter sp. YIC-464 TaxID=3376631 RepID=UPI003C17A3BC